MPIFNELRIDQKHLAKVKAVRYRVELTETDKPFNKEEFLKWHKSISKILSNQKLLTSCSIVHTFE